MSAQPIACARVFRGGAFAYHLIYFSWSADAFPGGAWLPAWRPISALIASSERLVGWHA